VLFGEDASRVVLSCDRSNLLGIKQLAVKYGVSANVIGETAGERLEINVDGEVAVSASVGELRDAYENALETALAAEVVG
jgi:hypothetical protein